MHDDMEQNTIKEKKENFFMDIVKDIVNLEKEFIVGHFGIINGDEKSSHFFARLIRNIMIAALIYGVAYCILNNSWTMQPFLKGICILASTVIVEMVLMIPIYFLGKRIPWVEKNKQKTFIIAALLILLTIFLL